MERTSEQIGTERVNKSELKKVAYKSELKESVNNSKLKEPVYK